VNTRLPSSLHSTASAPLTWALCTPTLNRIDVLLVSLGCTLAQTRQPAEIIIVDAGDACEANRARVEELMRDHPGIRLEYLPSPVRSITHQRNIASKVATADILFCLDDDTLMYPDCAERIMRAYETDQGGAIAGVTTGNHPVSPLSDLGIERKLSPLQDKVKRGGGIGQTRLGRWILREVFLLDTLRLFVPYDSRRAQPTETQVAHLKELGLAPVFSMIGFAMTVRRSVALAEPFDPWLLSYAPCEDTDATYRFSRHGMLVYANDARLHHYEVAGARLNRHRVAALFLLNVAFFLRQHSDDLPRHRRRYFALARRRILAEALKDGAGRRFRFPQVRGTLFALRHAASVFDHPDAGLGEFYQDLQRKVLQWA
jgi:glycosyltransferase involved in cell wall biosynthesis